MARMPAPIAASTLEKGKTAMTSENKPRLEVVPEEERGKPEPALAKPGTFNLNKFKSTRADTVASVDTLQSALPHHNISRADQGSKTRYVTPDRGKPGNAIPAKCQGATLPPGARKQTR